MTTDLKFCSHFLQLSLLLLFIFIFNVSFVEGGYRQEASHRIPSSFFEEHEIPSYFPQQVSTKTCGDKEFMLKPNLPSPDFFLIGGAKCGTTSFSEYIQAHPNVNEVSVKEPNFFSWSFISNFKYQKMHINSPPLDLTKPINQTAKISGDYTTSYLAHPLVPRRLYDFNPKVKLIIMIRNPIDRAYSHYIMSLRAKLETKSFEEVIARELEEIDELRYRFRYCFNSESCDQNLCYPRTVLHRHNPNATPFAVSQPIDLKDYLYTSYLFRSIYDDQVERYLMIFPRDQIYFLTSEELYADEVGTMEKISKWLNLPDFNWADAPQLNKSWGGGASNKYADPHSYEPMKNDTRILLRQFFEPYNARLYKLIGKNLGWN